MKLSTMLLLIRAGSPRVARWHASRESPVAHLPQIGKMARTAVGSFASLMYCNSIPARTSTKFAELSSPFSIINTCFSSKVQIPDSRKLNLDRKDKSLSALTAFLKSYDFSEADIDKIIKRYPQILSFRVSTNMKPKLDYLVECGLHGSALHCVIASEPRIFCVSLHKHIMPRYQFLKALFMEKANSVITGNHWLLRQSDVELCVEYLKKEGVPVVCISKLLARPCTQGMARIAYLGWLKKLRH